MIDFYKRVEKVREYRELKKGDFALMIGSKGGIYATLLKGKTANGDLAITLHGLFNINLNWLLTGEGAMYNEPIKTCNDFSLAHATIKMLIEHNAIEGMPKNSGYLGAVTAKGLEDLKEVATFQLKELKKTYKIIDAKGLSYPALLDTFDVRGSAVEKYHLIENIFYSQDVVYLIKNISLLKETEERKGSITREIIKILDDANKKGIEPKGNLIFIDTANFLEKNYQILGSYLTSNLTGD